MGARPTHILHVDMDAFFASVEQLDFPDLRGKPVIVGAQPGKRGVVSAASYEARAYGVRSAMPSAKAYALCPHGEFRPVRMQRYAEVSREVMAIFNDVTPEVQALSIDEAFLDVSGVMRRYASLREIAEGVKARIRDELGLGASIGCAPNKFLAKLASDLEKPDGLVEVPEDENGIIAFLAPLEVSRIWGVGRVTGERLKKHGIRTIGDLQACDPEKLVPALGANTAQHLWALAHGRDERSVETAVREKSISNEHTFGEDVRDEEVLHQVLLELTEKVGRRMRRAGFFARKASIKLRYDDFQTLSRQLTFPVPTNTDRNLLQAAFELFEKETLTGAVRLIGFGVGQLLHEDEMTSAQPDLFSGLVISSSCRS